MSPAPAAMGGAPLAPRRAGGMGNTPVSAGVGVRLGGPRQAAGSGVRIPLPASSAVRVHPRRPVGGGPPADLEPGMGDRRPAGGVGERRRPRQRGRGEGAPGRAPRPRERRPAPSRPGGRRAGGRVARRPPSARKSHFPDTAGALAELCEECPRRARGRRLAAAGHAPDTPPPAERRRPGNGITGAERCLFSAQCQETGPGGRRAPLPGRG